MMCSVDPPTDLNSSVMRVVIGHEGLTDSNVHVDGGSQIVVRLTPRSRMPNIWPLMSFNTPGACGARLGGTRTSISAPCSTTNRHATSGCTGSTTTDLNEATNDDTTPSPRIGARRRTEPARRTRGTCLLGQADHEIGRGTTGRRWRCSVRMARKVKRSSRGTNWGLARQDRWDRCCGLLRRCVYRLSRAVVEARVPDRRRSWRCRGRGWRRRSPRRFRCGSVDGWTMSALTLRRAVVNQCYAVFRRRRRHDPVADTIAAAEEDRIVERERVRACASSCRSVSVPCSCSGTGKG